MHMERHVTAWCRLLVIGALGPILGGLHLGLLGRRYLADGRVDRFTP
jgi:hypothetical protein